MAKRHLIVEMKHTKELESIAFAAEPAEAFDLAAAPKAPGVEFDTTFVPTPVPGTVPRPWPEELTDEDVRAGFDVYATDELFDLAVGPQESTYIVRCTADENRIEGLKRQRGVVGVYSDPRIEPTIVCPGSPPMGTDMHVERLLCTPSMRRIHMDGQGVLVAIVDTGVNIAYLNAHGKNPTFDAARSWVPRAGLVPGQLPVDHGTMCAYDVCIAAPRCTILDIALLKSQTGGPTIMAGFLSDGVRAYRHLLDIMLAPRRPGELRSLVVSNSWGMFHPSWDFPPGDPGNYSDNPNHPFNRIVGALERAGADIVFAAGNCGADCPDGRCQGVTTRAIYGANSHPAVLCVAGVDVTKHRVGYSAIGPGRLTRRKPDIAGYTHFRGSGVYPADGGTSAACPVVSGVVAAIRSKRPYDPQNATSRPSAIRALVTTNAEDLGAAGYDFQHGYGVIDGCALYRAFTRIIDICRRLPWLCEPRWINICRRYPEICRRIIRRIPGLPPLPPFPPRPPFPEPPGPPPLHEAEGGVRGYAAWDDLEAPVWDADATAEGGGPTEEEVLALVIEEAYRAGQAAGGDGGPAPGDPAAPPDCGCGKGGRSGAKAKGGG